jgi:hypothetical protein
VMGLPSTAKFFIPMASIISYLELLKHIHDSLHTPLSLIFHFNQLPLGRHLRV